MPANGAPGRIRSTERANESATYTHRAAVCQPQGGRCDQETVTAPHVLGSPRVYLRGRTWWADVRFSDGSRIRRSTGETDRGIALRAALDIAHEATTTTGAAPRPVTLRALVESLWESRWAQSRAAITMRYVVPLVVREAGHWHANEITYATLSEYAKERRRAGLSPATVNRRLSIITTALREAHREGLCAAPPQAPHLREPPGRDRYVSAEEERAILAEIERRSRDAEAEKRPEWVYLGALVVALLDTGMRLSEALGTRSEHIRGDLLHISDHRTKSQRGRVIPLTPRALDALRLMLGHECHAEASVDWCGHRFMVVRKKLGLPDVCLHVLRHSCAARLLAAGVDIYTVSRWLGHSSVKVTERYAKLQTGMLANARAALLAATGS